MVGACPSTGGNFHSKVGEVHPLQSPKGGGEMKAIAAIEAEAVARKILGHPDLWQTRGG